jgi:transposase
MIRYVGLDVHKRFIEVCILDGKGNVQFRGRADCDRRALESFARQRLKKSDRVALEATTNTWPVAEILRPFVAAVVVSNPLKTKAIAEAKIKTDKVDAEVLAHLLRCDYLPQVWQPDEKTQILRGLITHRTGLMTQRARHKNRIQCLLGRLLIHPPCKVLWTKTGLAWLKRIELPPTERLVLDSELRQLDGVESELASLDEQLIAIAGDEPRVRLLMTLPGVSHVVAIGLLAALGDVHRFRDGDHAASYLGLVPITRQSGKHCYHGRITKAGNSQARWLLTQSCQHVARHPGPLGAFFRRLAKRKNRQVAIVAVARKLVTIAYLMLKNNEPYRYAKPKLMAEKFGALDRAAAGTKGRKSRRAKPGPTAQARAGLAAVFANAGLPKATPPADLPAGEQRMLKERRLQDFVSELYSPTTGQAPAKTRQTDKPGRPTGRQP